MKKIGRITSLDCEAGEAVVSFETASSFAYQRNCKEESIFCLGKWVVCLVEADTSSKNLNIIEMYSLVDEKEFLKTQVANIDLGARHAIFSEVPAVRDEIVENDVKRLEYGIKQKIIKQVWKFDVVSFANSIFAEVHISTRCKPGDDDTFSVEALVRMPPERDDYLKSLIKDYSPNIFFEHSMTALHNNRDVNLYKESKNRIIVEVKRKFVVDYVRSDHIKSLLEIEIKELRRRLCNNLYHTGNVNTAPTSLA